MFVAVKACLSVAVRKGLIVHNPALSAEGVHVDPIDVGEVLPREEFASFLAGFHKHPLDRIVMTALQTGARLNEILAIQHGDIDYQAGTLRVARAVERSKAYGTRFKAPKNGKVRELAIDDALLAMFNEERRKLASLLSRDLQQSIDAAEVIPAVALIFYGFPMTGPQTFLKPRCSWDISRNFRTRAKSLGYAKLRFHDLRRSHETALLDAGIPVHVVAARCGHSPEMLLRSYARRTHSSDNRAAKAICEIMAGL